MEDEMPCVLTMVIIYKFMNFNDDDWLIQNKHNNIVNIAENKITKTNDIVINSRLPVRGKIRLPKVMWRRTKTNMKILSG